MMWQRMGLSTWALFGCVKLHQIFLALLFMASWSVTLLTFALTGTTCLFQTTELWEVMDVFCRLFIYLFFFYLLLLLFLLYNIVLVLPYINMHPPRVYTCSPSWTPLPPPSPYHPSVSSQCTSPKQLVSCIEPEQRFVSYMILYMFQCHSPKSSHPLPLPQSPKDCSIHLCLFCCFTSVGGIVPSWRR